MGSAHLLLGGARRDKQRGQERREDTGEEIGEQVRQPLPHPRGMRHRVHDPRGVRRRGHEEEADILRRPRRIVHERPERPVAARRVRTQVSATDKRLPHDCRLGQRANRGD